MTGSYTVTVTDNKGCKASGSTSAITVNPSLVVKDSSNSPVCAGGQIVLGASSSNGTSPFGYSWTGPGFTSLQAAPTISGASGANQGAYIVVITDTHGCKGSDTTNVTVNATASVTAGSNSPVCTGKAIDLNASLSGGTGPFHYKWNGPLSFSDTTATPVRANALTTYQGSYGVTVTDNNGCSGTGTTFVNVNSTPTETA